MFIITGLTIARVTLMWLMNSLCTNAKRGGDMPITMRRWSPPSFGRITPGTINDAIILPNEYHAVRHGRILPFKTSSA